MVVRAIIKNDSVVLCPQCGSKFSYGKILDQFPDLVQTDAVTVKCSGCNTSLTLRSKWTFEIFAEPGKKM